MACGHWSTGDEQGDDAVMSDLNDPRVLFAAERTLLAWNRTSVSLMAFGFVVERFGLFLEMIGRDELKVLQRHVSFYIGLSFILVAALISLYSTWQHTRILRSVRPAEIPPGYNLYIGMLTNGATGVLAVALIVYLWRGFV